MKKKVYRDKYASTIDIKKINVKDIKNYTKEVEKKTTRRRKKND